MVESMKKNNLFAVIDLGASAIRMVIAEQKEKKPYVVIESLTQSIRLGVDTFLTGLISQDSAIACTKTLKKFHRILTDYQVIDCRVVATSAVIEARNRDYFLDYVYRHTGFRIEAIDSQETCKMIYLSVLNEMSRANEILAPNSLLVDLGTGNARTVFIKEGKIIWIQSLKLGSLRLREILHDIDVQSFEFHKVLQAFIQADIDLMKRLTPLLKIEQFIATGSMIGDILRYLAPQFADKTFLKVEADWFLKIFTKYKNVTIEQFIEEKKVPLEKADILLPAIIVYWYYASIFKANCIIVTESSLAEGVILDRLAPIPDFNAHILASARSLNTRFASDAPHAEKVLELAEQIFEQTNPLHKLSADYLLILKVAALLHDIGYFVDDRKHHQHSEYLIMASPITGLTDRQRACIAFVARNHRHYEIKFQPGKPIEFSNDERTSLTKLVAMLRIANALDKSHTASVEKLKIKYKKDQQQLVFKIITKMNLPLEKWAFSHSIQLFKDLFFVDCILTESRDLG